MVGSTHLLLRDVAFDVEPGEILGIVGESGSGKTMASLAVIGLLPNAIELRGGSIKLEGTELTGAANTTGRSSADVSMIFQQPRSALNPTMRAGRQVARVLETNQDLSKTDAKAEAIEMLKHVGIPGAERVARAYPHQLSGGMCQRVMIAMALACKPRLLIADEPTTALDVTIQAQIFDLIRSLVDEIGCGVLFITHDLGVIAEIADDVAVMYLGQVVETGPVEEIFESPKHPYTIALLNSIPSMVAAPRDRLPSITGAIPHPQNRPSGCPFHPRCPSFIPDVCNQREPSTTMIDSDRKVRCFLHEAI